MTTTERAGTGPLVAVTADELAALAWVFDAQAIVVEGPTILDEVGEHRDAVAGCLLLSLAAKGVVDLDAPEGEPRLRPVPELPSLPAQVTNPDRWIRLHRADEHGRRTRHLLAHEDEWLVMDVVGGLHVIAATTAADVRRLATTALDLRPTEDPPEQRPDPSAASDPGAAPDPPTAPDQVPGPPTGGSRSDLWACGPAGGHLSRRWQRWRGALTPTPHAAVRVDLTAITKGTMARDWFTVLASGSTWWISQPDPDAAVEDPSLLGNETAPAVTDRIDAEALLALLGHWLPEGQASDARGNRPRSP